MRVLKIGEGEHKRLYLEAKSRMERNHVEHVLLSGERVHSYEESDYTQLFTKFPTASEIECLLCEDTSDNKIAIVAEYKNIKEVYLFEDGVLLTEVIQQIHRSGRDTIISKGKSYNVSLDPEIEVLEDIELEVSGNTLQERFMSVVGKVSDLSAEINKNMSLEDTKEVAKQFTEARNKINELLGSEPSKMGTLFKKYLPEKLTKKVADIKYNNDSVQENINYLFGVIHTKYEKLISIGTQLQKTKVQMEAQIKALEDLVVESEKEISSYETEANIPISKVSLDTQLKATVEKLRNRLLKIDGSIIACQSTIRALGKDLPALKTDLTDEMAIGGLLNSVDDYQKMYTEIAELVANVTKDTAEKTHMVIENLMQMQIDDTHTMKYLAESKTRGDKFANMLLDKSTKLAEKVQRDAKFISEVAKGTPIENVRKSMKLLD